MGQSTVGVAADEELVELIHKADDRLATHVQQGNQSFAQAVAGRTFFGQASSVDVEVFDLHLFSQALDGVAFARTTGSSDDEVRTDLSFTGIKDGQDTADCVNCLK